MSRAERRTKSETPRRVDPHSEELYSGIAMHLDRLAPLSPNQGITIRTGQANTSLGIQDIWIQRFDLNPQRNKKDVDDEPRSIVTQVRVVEPFSSHQMVAFFPAGTSQAIDGLVTEVPLTRFAAIRLEHRTGATLRRERERFQRTALLSKNQERTNELSAKLLQILAEFQDNDLTENSLFAETQGIDNNLELLKLLHPLINEAFGPVTQQEVAGDEPLVKALIANDGDAMILQTHAFQLPRHLRLIDTVFGTFSGEKMSQDHGLCRSLHAIVKDRHDPTGKTYHHYYWIEGAPLLAYSQILVPDMAMGSEELMSFFFDKIDGEAPNGKLDETRMQELFETVRRLTQENRSK